MVSVLGRVVAAAANTAVGMMLLWKSRQMRILLTTLMVLWLSCESEGKKCTPKLTQRELYYPMTLPAAIQFFPFTPFEWKNLWEVVVDDVGITIICLLIESNTTATIVRSAATSCNCVTQYSWGNPVVWPQFVRHERYWQNHYTVFISATEDAITFQLNQKQETGLTQITKTTNVTSMKRVNTTYNAPGVQVISKLESLMRCAIMKGCTTEWIYLSISPSDTIFLLPDSTLDLIEVKVSMSKCFPEYLIGKKVNSTTLFGTGLKELPLKLELSYTFGYLAHTLDARIGSQYLISMTLYHHGNDCTNGRYLLGVKGATVIPNCNSSWRAYIRKPVTSGETYSLKQVSLPALLFCQIFIFFVLQ